MVAVLNDKLRIVVGSCGLQWVVQKRKNPLAWGSFAFCATKEGLLLRLPKDGRGCAADSLAIIQALPDHFPKIPAEKQAGEIDLRACATASGT